MAVGAMSYSTEAKAQRERQSGESCGNCDYFVARLYGDYCVNPDYARIQTQVDSWCCNYERKPEELI